jgi:RNA polymerase sigma factor (TIGR02999 family)
MSDFTSLLHAADSGDRDAEERAARMLYDELRAIARREMAGERPDHTLQPTALVHEAYLRLSGERSAPFESRQQFWAAAARSIRQILVEHARARGRLKRGDGAVRVDLDEALWTAEHRDAQVEALDTALSRLARIDPDKAKLVELRFFAGLTLDAAAAALGVSQSTVVREWRTARAWLQAAIDDAQPER